MSENFTPALSTKSSRLEKKVEGFCLIFAPVLFAASTFFWQNGEYGVEAAILIIFSMFFWIPALTGLFSLIKNEMPRYAVWGLWIAVFGCISGVCFAFLGYLATIFNISHEQYLYSLSHYPVTSQILLFGSGPIIPVKHFGSWSQFDAETICSGLARFIILSCGDCFSFKPHSTH